MTPYINIEQQSARFRYNILEDTIALPAVIDVIQLICRDWKIMGELSAADQENKRLKAYDVHNFSSERISSCWLVS